MSGTFFIGNSPLSFMFVFRNASSLRTASRRDSSMAFEYVETIEVVECPSRCATCMSAAPAAVRLRIPNEPVFEWVA